MVTGRSASKRSLEELELECRFRQRTPNGPLQEWRAAVDRDSGQNGESRQDKIETRTFSAKLVVDDGKSKQRRSNRQQYHSLLETRRSSDLYILGL